MLLVQDQLGRTIKLPQVPKRIVSLVPSQTELLYHLDLEAEVVGITKFCVHPAHWFQTKTRIGGTKQLHLQTIKALQPDLIIANKEENVKEQIDELEQTFPVWVSDVSHLDDALQMIKALGALTGKEREADGLALHIANDFALLQEEKSHILYNTCYLIWREPYMTIGGDTFISDILAKGGFKNGFADQKRYPVLSRDQLLESAPEVILFSSEPYPFKQEHIEEVTALFRKAGKPVPKMMLTDGELISWYGSRLLHTPAYLSKLQQQLKAL